MSNNNTRILADFFDKLFAKTPVREEYKQIVKELQNIDQRSERHVQVLAKLEVLLDQINLEPEDLQNIDKLFEDNLEAIAASQSPVIIGNGDIKNHADASQKVLETGVDGVMIGRGIFSNPFAFNTNIIEDKQGKLVDVTTGEIVGRERKLQLLSYHLELWQNTWQEQKNYSALKKYFKIYVSGFDGASDLRVKLMNTANIDQAMDIIHKVLNLPEEQLR